MKCPKCGSTDIDTINTDVEYEDNYGCRECDCWFTIHDETYTKLADELKYEMADYKSP
jgi:transposase-like protein